MKVIQNQKHLRNRLSPILILMTITLLKTSQMFKKLMQAMTKTLIQALMKAAK